MTTSITFLHVADVHLGAPARGLRALDAEWTDRILRSIPEAYDRVIETAVTRNVDFVVFAGDMFDAARPSYKDYLHFYDGLQRLDDAGIPSYLVAGNHDPYTTWSHDMTRLPSSAHFMGVDGREFTVFERDGEPLCLIGARSYYNQTWPAGEDISDGITREAAEASIDEVGRRTAPFAVGIIHTGLEIDREKAPSNEAKLLASGIDYWACGHLHKQYIRPSERDPRIVFPGCIQGRDIKETGDRGCLLVTLERDDNAVISASAPSSAIASENVTPTGVADGSNSGLAHVRLESVPTASIAFQSLEVDVSACQTLADVVRHVQSNMFHENGKTHCENMIGRIMLTGNTALHGFLVRDDVLHELRKRINDAYPSFFCDALIDRTQSLGEEMRELQQGLFPSVVSRIAREEREREDVLVNYVQAELVKRGISVPNSLSRRAGAYSDEAEALILDLLQDKGLVESTEKT